jgi:hypothetical protein
MADHNYFSNLIWQIADLLRGPYRPPQYERVMLPMREANILYLVVSKFCDVDLHPNTVPNQQMGLIFENLIRRFNELANETAGDHFTPREVIRLMVSILFIHDDKLLATPGTVRKLLDPACGTGGMLAEAQNYLREHHGAAKLYVYGHVPDAWMDRAKDKVGYEMNFNRHFYKYTPPRPLETIDAELKQAEEEIMRLLREVTS